MKQISADLQDLFDEPDFEHVLRVLARELGDVKLSEVKGAFDQCRAMPEHEVDGVTYYAGYNGRYMVEPASYKAKLLSITKNKNLVKLMMGIPSGSVALLKDMKPGTGPSTEENVFLYYSRDKNAVSVDNVLNLTARIGKMFNVVVNNIIVVQTGERHAIIDSFRDDNGNEFHPL